MDGTEVERYFLDGKIKEIADYCESDVVNTYRGWLRYELFRGKLSDVAFQASETDLGRCRDWLLNFMRDKFPRFLPAK
jgi:3'-5' exonuclease